MSPTLSQIFSNIRYIKAGDLGNLRPSGELAGEEPSSAQIHGKKRFGRSLRISSCPLGDYSYILQDDRRPSENIFEFMKPANVDSPELQMIGSCLPLPAPLVMRSDRALRRAMMRMRSGNFLLYVLFD